MNTPRFAWLRQTPSIFETAGKSAVVGAGLRLGRIAAGGAKAVYRAPAASNPAFAFNRAVNAAKMGPGMAGAAGSAGARATMGGAAAAPAAGRGFFGSRAGKAVGGLGLGLGSIPAVGAIKHMGGAYDQNTAEGNYHWQRQRMQGYGQTNRIGEMLASPFHSAASLMFASGQAPDQIRHASRSGGKMNPDGTWTETVRYGSPTNSPRLDYARGQAEKYMNDYLAPTMAAGVSGGGAIGSDGRRLPTEMQPTQQDFYGDVFKKFQAAQGMKEKPAPVAETPNYAGFANDPRYPPGTFPQYTPGVNGMLRNL